MMNRTLRLADAWHLDADGDVTDFDGYSLARLWRWLLWVRTLHPAFKFLTALTHAVERYDPQVVHCEDSVPPLYREVLACAAGPLRFRVADVASGGPRAVNPEWSLPTAAASTTKFLAGRLFNAALPRGDRRRDWLFSYYHSLEPVASAARAHGAAISFADFPLPRRLPGLMGKASIWLEPASPPSPSADDEASIRSLTARWDRLRVSPDFTTRFDWKGVSLRRAIEPILDGLVRTGSRPWAWTCRQLDRRWRSAPPALLVLPFPGPPYQQALQMAARRYGTPAAVILHGLPMSYSFPFEQPQEGHFLVWGPEQEDHYRPHALRAGFSVVQAGNPYFDRYAGRRRERTGPIRRVLLLTHPVSWTTPLSSNLDPARHAVGAAEVLSRFPEIEATLRLHPSESVDEYRRLIADIAPRMRVVKGGPLDACLEEHDLIVGSFSTVLMEGMLLGLPVAALNLSRDEFPPPFDGRRSVPLLRSEDDLDALLRRALADPAAFRRSVCSGHDEILERFAGPVDGKAASRVVESLEALTTKARIS